MGRAVTFTGEAEPIQEKIGKISMVIETIFFFVFASLTHNGSAYLVNMKHEWS